MHEPPSDLPDATLRAWVQARYGGNIAELTFLPLGHDPCAWGYRVRASAAGDYFLKLRRGALNAASLTLARTLRDRGVARIVAGHPPLPASLPG